ncbi:uncharacterized protein NECHADRAFT_92249 [Fusarium vanettenii 77-13-4]|uniref:Aminoglycoside phosphotransferase domain-containing protein n=1 Tax=Fusarium vanettenii (strain ATCC MYA-4622 / CBS 123669 / FGSC 9596 / NRRL 45880 / 77-13-4) TaxID=660122 RepID=C7ZFK8_FUSV7|nr:uncharacterized protein NECHADRAFT_92249 [Fusarium vanettenii 77-13-4]EEU37261.1 hypothetical protein NECHADRAFT_92249 [Fusarium vanettenii 77-13-4]
MPKKQKPRDTCPESLVINNSPLRRFLTLLGLKTTSRLFRRRGACVPISKHLIVKSDSFVDLTEAATMRFVATNTSVPVPKVWCSFVRNGRVYIVMERIRGDCISTGWDERSQESRNKLLAQLKLLIENLRLLQPLPGTGVESCTGGSLFDSRIARSGGRFGPFKTIQDFHLWLRDNLQPSEVEKPEQASQEDWNDPVLTHGDLNPSNILVRGDEIVGIIDWEFSGWYPHYWEYTSAWCTQTMSTEWQNLLGDFLEPYVEELRMERTRQRWWGEV